MDNKIEERNIKSEILDTPWIHKQVDSHIIFGFLANQIKLRYILIPMLCIMSILLMLEDLLQSLFIIAPFLVAINLLKKTNRFTRLASGWLVTKFTITIVSFLFIIVAFPNSLKENQSDAIPNLLLGLLWFPLLEFFPKITKNQKYLTICRLILTVPIVYLGIRSGQWHWK